MYFGVKHEYWYRTSEEWGFFLGKDGIKRIRNRVRIRILTVPSGRIIRSANYVRLEDEVPGLCIEKRILMDPPRRIFGSGQGPDPRIARIWSEVPDRNSDPDFLFLLGGFLRIRAGYGSAIARNWK